MRRSRHEVLHWGGQMIILSATSDVSTGAALRFFKEFVVWLDVFFGGSEPEDSSSVQILPELGCNRKLSL